MLSNEGSWTSWVGVNSMLNPGFVIFGKIVVVSADKVIKSSLGVNDTILTGFPIQIITYPTLNFSFPETGYTGQAYIDSSGNVKTFEPVEINTPYLSNLNGVYIIK